MAPEGWHSARLGDFFRSRRERGKAGLQTMSVTLDRGLVPRASLDRKTDTNLSAEEHLLVKKNDISYNMMRMWQGASGLASCDGLVSPAYVVLKPTSAIDPIFASYFFKAARTIYLFWAYSYGLTSDRLRLYFRDFSLIPVVVPPISEQRRIGQILQAWDSAIKTVEELIANSVDQQKALAQRLLTGAIRLKQFSGPSWTHVSVAEMGEVIGGGTPDSTKSAYWDGTIPWATPTDIGNQRSRFISKTERTISELGLKNSAARVLPAGALLICTRATIGELAIALKPIATNQGFKSLIPREGFDVDFLYYLFSLHKPTFIRYACGSTFLELSKRDLRKRTFHIPALPEQRAIAKILNAIEDERTLLEKNLLDLRRERSAVMQQLFTGKRRVRLENAVEQVAVA